MYYSVIKEYDIANGPGCRTTLFVSGCRNHCKGCFQPETWDFSYGVPYDLSTQERLLDSLELPPEQREQILCGTAKTLLGIN